VSEPSSEFWTPQQGICRRAIPSVLLSISSLRTFHLTDDKKKRTSSQEPRTKNAQTSWQGPLCLPGTPLLDIGHEGTCIIEYKKIVDENDQPVYPLRLIVSQ
jgi:hypothetical protein